MTDKPFVRVRDKRTRHQFDVHIQAFDESKHEEIKRIPRSKVARPAKPHVNLKPATQAVKTSTPAVVEGVSPASE